MSTPRLILKQPTGWFAAGGEFAQAITLLSDGAFKLYVYACLRANRHTGCLNATVNELARGLGKARQVITRDIAELEDRAVCSVTKDGNSNYMLAIRDRFWPYQRQQTPGRVLAPETEFVQKVRRLFLEPACVHASFSAADERLALDMYRRGVSMQQITRAILLGCARKYVAMLNAGTRTPITSLQYFADIVEEVNDAAIPESYWEPLRSKMVRMEQRWQQGNQTRT
jgi:hypothetical protein